MALSQDEIASRWPKLESVSKTLLPYLGPGFTATPAGHIQTDLAATGSLSGLMILQETVPNLKEIANGPAGPGNALLSEVYEGQDDVMRFLAGMAYGNDLKWPEDVTVSREHKPLMECEEMTLKLTPPFYAACREEKLEKEYYKLAAALTGFCLVLGGNNHKLLAADIGFNILTYYVVAGSKTIPYPDALWE